MKFSKVRKISVLLDQGKNMTIFSVYMLMGERCNLIRMTPVPELNPFF